ncbi:MAG: 16S rRNA (cytosine(1402)-N(4))-methyltransferase RsmH [Phycisphaerales bacterium]|nr:16S rRNA (cytosine(1402)-N(4))-methyltransferase RsmH [Phycisphaerales bacterium]
MARPDSHIPVLAREVIEVLAPQPGDVLLDCTAGLGGHAAVMAPALGHAGTMVLCDLDVGNLARAEVVVRAAAPDIRVIALHTNFAAAPQRLLELGLAADCVLGDLGFSSNQMDTAARGMSFMREGPLDMRLDASSGVSAADLVATLSGAELEEILREYGEERCAWQIAQKVVTERARQPITTTAQLAAIVRSVVGRHGGGGNAAIDDATRTFQALRIAVNDELGNLGALLEHVRRAAGVLAGARGRGGEAPATRGTWLSPGSRVAIIAFHSLEDRPVKQAFAALVEKGLAESMTRKPITAGDEEIARNPRSRSAKLRAVRIGAANRGVDGLH